MYNPITKKFVISRDVKFMEDKSWNEIADGTCHNPFVVFDEAPTTNLPRLQVQTESSPSSSSDSDKTSGSDFDFDKNQRMRSLSDIYAQDGNDNLVLFAFLSSQPAYFEEAVKKNEWASKKQPIVSLSSTEEEYVAATTTTCQAVWLKRLLLDFGYTEKDPTTIFCDNVSAMSLSKNNMFHQKSKHIDTRFHFLRELVKNGDITLKFCSSKEELTDVFTKPLRIINFEFQRQSLNIKECNT